MMDREPLIIEVLARSNGNQSAVLDRVIGGAVSITEGKPKTFLALTPSSPTVLSMARRGMSQKN
jgi:hypothetical protein